MSEPCHQEVRIHSISQTLDRLEDSNLRILGVIEKIAEQGAFIRALQEQSNRQEKDTDSLYTRMRDVEIRVESASVRLGFLVTAVSIFVSGITAWVVKSFKE